MSVVPVRDLSHWHLRVMAFFARLFHKQGLSCDRCESRWCRHCLIGLLLVLLLGVALSLFPPVRLADKLAEIVPAAWIRVAAQRAQDELDRSQLRLPLSSGERIETLTTRFASLTAPANGAPPYRLLFRNGGQSGALLYSLPDGLIVLSDELLSALPDDTEILALLCHELGHIYYRHALRAAIESRFLSIGAVSLLGFENQAVSLLARGFLDSSLSEGSGLQADQFARRMLEANGISASKLDSALARLATLPRQASIPVTLLQNPTRQDLDVRLGLTRNGR